MKRIISHSHVSAAFLIAALTFNACTPQSGNTKEANTTSVVQTSVDNLDVKVLKGQYDLNTKLFNNALVNISESEANQQFNGTANNVKRIAGHALFLNYSLANLLTVESQNPYDAQFGIGKPFDPNAAYPTLEKIISDWNALSPKVGAALEEMTKDQLDSDSPFPIPYSEQTIRGIISFQMHHLGYHIGQIGIYRKFLSKEPMSYQ
ncbi:MAG: DinB family protein [Chlamydiota bacterium]